MFFAAELKDSEKRIRNLAHINSKGKIGQDLLILQDKFGDDPNGFINIDITRQDLASYSGTTYKTLFKMPKEMAEEHILKIADKKISVADSKKLTLVLSQNG